MTRTSEVKIQPPLPLRIYAAGFLIIWTCAVAWTTIIHHHGSSIIAGVIFDLFGCAIGSQIFRIGVYSEPGGALRVQNHFGRRVLTRAEIEEFRMGNNGGRRLGQRDVQALLRDGTTFGLDVCRAPFGIGERRLVRQLDELNAWLRATD